MDVAALSTGISQMKLAQAVSVKVAKMSMDNMKQQSTDMAKMLEQSVQPHLGGSIDLRL